MGRAPQAGTENRENNPMQSRAGLGSQHSNKGKRRRPVTPVPGPIAMIRRQRLPRTRFGVPVHFAIAHGTREPTYRPPHVSECRICWLAAKPRTPTLGYFAHRFTDSDRIKVSVEEAPDLRRFRNREAKHRNRLDRYPCICIFVFGTYVVPVAGSGCWSRQEALMRAARTRLSFYSC